MKFHKDNSSFSFPEIKNRKHSTAYFFLQFIVLFTITNLYINEKHLCLYLECFIQISNMKINHFFLNQKLIQKSWKDYYSTIDPPTENNNYFNLTLNSQNKTLQPKENNAYVYNCYFYKLSASEGGAILYSISGSYLLVEKCSICNCTATEYTAGIRIKAGNCIIAFVCSQYGYAGTNDAFCSFTNDEKTRTINSVFDSSVSHCEASSSYIMVHNHGYVYIKSLNLSNNNANYYSALICNPNKNNEETSHGNDIIYSSISNNTATIQYCVVVGSTAEIKNCNIISNDAKNTIHGSDQTDVISCCVIKNTKRPVFSGSIKLYNCSVSSDQFEGSNVNTNSLGTTTFIHGLTFLETGDCKASFDATCSIIPTIPDFLFALNSYNVILMSEYLFLLSSLPF